MRSRRCLVCRISWGEREPPWGESEGREKVDRRDVASMKDRSVWIAGVGWAMDKLQCQLLESTIAKEQMTDQSYAVFISPVWMFPFSAPSYSSRLVARTTASSVSGFKLCSDSSRRTVFRAISNSANQPCSLPLQSK